MKITNVVMIGMTAILSPFLVSKGTAQGGYKGIVPMQSTCRDVKNILEEGACGTGVQFFSLPEETLKIVYTTKDCEDFYGKKWNVPIGTVVSITRLFRRSPTWQGLGLTINESEFDKQYTDVIGQIIYVRKKGGLIITATHDYISSIKHTPTEEDYSKVCASPKGSSHSSVKDCGRPPKTE